MEYLAFIDHKQKLTAIYCCEKKGWFGNMVYGRDDAAVKPQETMGWGEPKKISALAPSEHIG